MTAVILVRITVKDPEKMKAYSAAAAPTVADYGGEFILRGKHVADLLGVDPSQAFAVIQFPSTEVAQAWFNSPEHQALQTLRDAAADIYFTLFETP